MVLQAAVEPERAVTAVIHTEVGSDRREDFHHWHAEITAAQSKWPGYLGSALRPPIPGVDETWTTLVTFDSDEHLEAWLRSDARRTLIDRADHMRDLSTRTVSSGFAQWFREPIGQAATAPAPWKFNWLILLGLYPIVMTEILFLNPLLGWTNLAFGTLIGNVLSVAVLGWPVVAVLSKVMRWWLTGAPDENRRRDAYGAAIVLAALTVFVAFFYLVGPHIHIIPVTKL
jgi:antibiotic biosynthesis monooxygenase (ABM) superfamily enzyme